MEASSLMPIILLSVVTVGGVIWLNVAAARFWSSLDPQERERLEREIDQESGW
jgi:hypothetical protein